MSEIFKDDTELVSADVSNNKLNFEQAMQLPTVLSSFWIRALSSALHVLDDLSGFGNNSLLRLIERFYNATKRTVM